MSFSALSLSRMLQSSLSPAARSVSVLGGRCVCGQVSVVRSYAAARLGADASGRPTTWDSFGIWDNRIETSILLPPSIRYGTPIPRLSLSIVGCASHIGLRRNNEDRLRVSELTPNTLYFALFDGHGGAQAADFCSTHMERYIRIRNSGGFVTWNSLGQANVNSRLAMTRSIGDFDLKNLGVIAEPETTRTTVSVCVCVFELFSLFSVM
uniref:Protein phosphatase, Mg2+/Mn2+ dependent 1K n=1 Tax=Astyanax mexicanus TaxID=7994 RepID=A0A3B1J1V1_ASTMX